MLKTKTIVNSEYHFSRCLGEGLSSTVYEAVRSNSSGIQSERVAVKILKSENSVSWLQNEFESLRRVNSLHCVRVLGHESFEEGPALILELIDGVTLFELGQKFQLNDSEISQIGAQVFEGLRAINAVGFAHGDLNPKNILISRAGEVKLIDFGSFTNASSGASELIGSLPYISKQIWEAGRATIESDLASWGLIAGDLRSQFRSLPKNEEEARLRAVKNVTCEGFEESEAAKFSLAVKVESILSARQCEISTAIISDFNKAKRVSPVRNSLLKAAPLWMMAILLGVVILPAQNLLSEPLKAADLKPIEPASLLVRTHAWTEVSVNGKSKGYSPITLHNLAPGNYRIKYKRSRGEGEIILALKPGQKRLLKDADFKYTNSKNNSALNNRGDHESRSDRRP